MSAEGAVSRMGRDAGVDELVEGERALYHKEFLVADGAGMVDRDDADTDTGGRVHRIRIRCVRQLALDEAVGLLGGDDATGLMVWDAGRLMLRRLAAEWAAPDAAVPATIVELGAGVGFVSIAAAALASPAATLVVATDGNPEVVEAAEKNVALNEAAVQGEAAAAAAELAYMDAAQLAAVKERIGGGPCGLVLACDVIYHQEVVEPLFETAARLVGAEGGRFLLSYVPRAWSDGENVEIMRAVLECAGAAGFAAPTELETLPVMPPDGSGESTVTNTLFEFVLERVPASS